MRWPSHLRIAVNISTVQLRHPDFLGHVIGALTASPIAPERIEIEVTESALLDDSPATLAVLTKLQQMGLKVALDDFGTGWSSLSYLNRHRFDRIKIDRSFVQGLSDRRNEAIVQTIIDLGARLDIEITAEGVEKLEQLEALGRMRCHEAQGWFFGKPIPAADLPFQVNQRSTLGATKRYVGGLR
jgi:EAL domain-containing protein (putative c-di-GMP-specific phosphodiesterase class I)